MAVHPSVRSHAQWPRLAELVHELAFLDGGSDDAFTLASGRQSRWFFDTKPVMMHPEAGRILGELLNLRINEMGARFVGGLELGAVPLTALWWPRRTTIFAGSWFENPQRAAAVAKPTTLLASKVRHWQEEERW